MPTFQGSLVEASGNNYVGRQQPRYTHEVTPYVSTFTIPTGFATNDVVEMCKVGVGFKVLEVQLSSNAAVGATANLSVGDAGSTARFISSTAYTGAVITRLNAPATGAGFVYTVNDTIDVFAVGIATPTVGTIITLVVLGTFL
jgi:hypothetical protein